MVRSCLSAMFEAVAIALKSSISKMPNGVSTKKKIFFWWSSCCAQFSCGRSHMRDGADIYFTASVVSFVGAWLFFLLITYVFRIRTWKWPSWSWWSLVWHHSLAWWNSSLASRHPVPQGKSRWERERESGERCTSSLAAAQTFPSGFHTYITLDPWCALILCPRGRVNLELWIFNMMKTVRGGAIEAMSGWNTLEQVSASLRVVKV